VDHIRRVVLGLGSNVGDRVKNLNDAIQALRSDRDIHVLSVSPFYETDAVLSDAVLSDAVLSAAAVQGPPQPAFVNGAVLLLTSLPAAEVLARALAVEQKLGRVRPPIGSPKEPRTIDLDLLWIEGEHVEEGDLRVPHPRLHDRAFAVRPLLDLAPDARDEKGVAYADLPAAAVELKRCAT
jgi:2-amino-4-hydroxy-6-hydroxymethyldihydropteridine diphosphokinase